MVCILPTQMMLEDAYSLAERQCLPLIKKFSKELSIFRANGFLSLQETLSHPLLMPLLEDPKMELKTFLLPLRLGLLTAFHQSTEVNIFTIRVFPPCVSSLQSIFFYVVATVKKKKKDT